MRKPVTATLILAIIIASCKTSEPVKIITPAKTGLDSEIPTVSYIKDIKPIFDQYCTSCHGNEAGYNFTAIADINQAVKNGSLMGSIKWQVGFSKMPAGSDQLDQNTINKIECWINNGLQP